MTINLNVPEDIAQHLAAHGEDLSRIALEAVAIEGYRSGTLTGYEVRRLLNFETRYELDGFLKQHNVWEKVYSLEDLQQDQETWQHINQ